jgi:hypothetical protein
MNDTILKMSKAKEFCLSFLSEFQPPEVALKVMIEMSEKEAAMYGKQFHQQLIFVRRCHRQIIRELYANCENH